MITVEDLVVGRKFNLLGQVVELTGVPSDTRTTISFVSYKGDAEGNALTSYFLAHAENIPTYTTFPWTNAEYAGKSGLCCPACGSAKIESVGDVQVDSGSVWQEVTCNFCQATWNDVFILAGYSGLETTK